MQNTKSYAERAQYNPFPLAKKLLKLMSEKETNLAFSADITKKDRLLELCEILGPHICVLKTHLDVIDDFDANLPHQLKALAEKHGFMILEDRKFADIGSTVQAQYRSGYLKIVDWADLVTVHGIAGSGTVEGLKEVASTKERGCLLLAEMSSSGNLLSDTYRDAIIAMAQKHPDFVLGFIAQRRLLNDSNFIYFTPGIGIEESKDHLGQNYKDPRLAVLNQGTDVIIVGRHIYKSEDPLREALRYRQLAWQGYCERSSQSILN